MRLHVEDVIGFPQALVYETQRDEMANLVEYLPNIAKIDVLEREAIEGGVRLVNLWTAAETEVPALVRSFIKPEMLSWKDYARWNDASFSCEWRLEMNFFREQVKTTGRTTYTRIDDRSVRSVIEGVLEVDARNVPGVPRLLAGKIGPEIEKFVVKMITPNLKGVNRGIEQYLKARS